MNTGEKIRRIRSQKDLTQKELAGLRESSIKKYEANERAPKNDQLKILAQALKVPIKSLLDDNILGDYITIERTMSLLFLLDECTNNADD